MESKKNNFSIRLVFLIFIWCWAGFLPPLTAYAQPSTVLSRPVTVAAVQYRAIPGRPGENRDNLRPLVIRAADHGAGLVVLPELCTTGMLWDSSSSAAPFAESVPGPTTRYFGQLARDRHLYIAAGLIEAHGSDLYNTQVLIGPNGQIAASYRKVNLYVTDQKWAKPGNLGYVSVKTDLGAVGLGICYDINFDDFIAFHANNGTDILAFSTNWVSSAMPFAYWKSRVDRAGFAFVAANNYGRERQIEFSGGSMILDRNNRELAITTLKQNTAIWGTFQNHTIR